MTHEKVPTGLSIKIDGHRYYAREWYTNKKDAQDRADKMRKTGQFLGVRVVKRLADRRYAIYWVANR